MSDRDPKPPSKRSARAGARALRRRPGWDPERVLAGRESATEQAGRGAAAASSAAAYESAAQCPQCDAQRETLNDETALCETHLAQAMGL